MAKTVLAVIKSWFETGKYPTAQQFADAWDSFRHKDDLVPMAEVDGLTDALNSKGSAEDVSAALTASASALATANEAAANTDALNERVTELENGLEALLETLQTI